MLVHLSIKNYALIDHLNVKFTNGFTVITGETGAGKTMVMGAVELLLGGRADPSIVRPGATEAVVEGRFVLGDGAGDGVVHGFGSVRGVVRLAERVMNPKAHADDFARAAYSEGCDGEVSGVAVAVVVVAPDATPDVVKFATHVVTTVACSRCICIYVYIH